MIKEKKNCTPSVLKNFDWSKQKSWSNKRFEYDYLHYNFSLRLMLWFRTNIKSSSAPLKRKIIGRGGIQSESTVTLANSSMDATKQKKTWR